MRPAQAFLVWNLPEKPSQPHENMRKDVGETTSNLDGQERFIHIRRILLKESRDELYIGRAGIPSVELPYRAV